MMLNLVDFVNLPPFLKNKIQIEPKSGCWLWMGATDKDGYALASTPTRAGKTVRAHREVFKRVKGAIDPELTLDHGCRVRRCVNPDHVEPVTNKVNILRGEGVCAKNARMMFCKNGHDLAEARVYKGERRCRICARDYMRLRRGKL